MSEQHRPAAFATVLADPTQPLIVGGQAVNLWAEIYVAAELELHAFEPFTSKDADIHGNRELASILQRRSGWTCRFFDEPRQTAVAILTKPVEGAASTLTVEVIRSVFGLNTEDLNRNLVRELRPGENYRLPDPFVMLKAKLANVAHLSVEKRPQDLKHARMLLPICRAYFLELHAAIGRPGLGSGGGADGDEIGGGADEELIAEFLVVADFIVHFGEAGEVARFFEVASEGAGGFEAGRFEFVFGFILGVGVAFGCGVGAGGDVLGGSGVGAEGGEIGGECQGRIPVPNGPVFGEVRQADAGFYGADAVG
jgi:hypothetical protein